VKSDLRGKMSADAVLPEL